MAKLKDNVKIALQGLAMVIIAIIVLEATSLIQYYFSRRQIYAEATGRAEAEMEMTNLKITGVMDQVETAVRNNAGGARKLLNTPDSLWSVTRRIVETNPFINGSAIAFKENHYRQKGKEFCPFTGRNGDQLDSVLVTDYFDREWFALPLELDGGYWSEPYYDEGSPILITTYSVPLTDDNDEVVAVLSADVSLKWLTDLVGDVEEYPGAFSLLVSRTGQLMVCPVNSLVMKQTVQQIAATMADSLSAMSVVRAMLAGERGEKTLLYQGEKEFVSYAPVERANWSMAIIIPQGAAMQEIRKVGGIVLLLQLLGVVILGYLLYAFARKQLKLREVSDKKNRIESELHVARDIQMSMLPKTFPPYPDRDDIDMYGLIVPAKEVGGDLYDFYIRDEKLFFCIGDVSGKGVPASLVMAVTRSLFRTVSAHESSPQRIVTSINDSMSETNESDMFVTFFIGVLDLQSGYLRYCNAGHNAPIRVAPHAAPAPLEVIPNLPLGVLPHYRFKEQEIRLSCGESLFFYTDGLTEAEDADHCLFGTDRLLKVLSKERGEQSAEQLVAPVIGAVKAHVKGNAASDDLTIFLLRYTNKEPSTGAERHLILHNDISQIPQLAEFVEAIASEAKLEQGLAMSLNLGLEEAVSNVILYAYPEGADALVDVEAVIWKDRLDFVITDSGVPFDPTAVSDPDLSLDVSERPVGGLGIYLVKSIMDQVSYTRENGKNILSMTKQLS